MVWPEICVLASLALLRSAVLSLHQGGDTWLAIMTVIALGVTGPLIVGTFLDGVRLDTDATIDKHLQDLQDQKWTSNPLRPDRRPSLRSRRSPSETYSQCFASCAQICQNNQAQWRSHRQNPFAYRVSWAGLQEDVGVNTWAEVVQVVPESGLAWKDISITTPL